MCLLCCQGDGYDLCSALSAGGPDTERAGGRHPSTDRQDRSDGEGPESLQEPAVSTAPPVTENL